MVDVQPLDPPFRLTGSIAAARIRISRTSCSIALAHTSTRLDKSLTDVIPNTGASTTDLKMELSLPHDGG